MSGIYCNMIDMNENLRCCNWFSKSSDWNCQVLLKLFRHEVILVYVECVQQTEISHPMVRCFSKGRPSQRGSAFNHLGWKFIVNHNIRLEKAHFKVEPSFKLILRVNIDLSFLSKDFLMPAWQNRLNWVANKFTFCLFVLLLTLLLCTYVSNWMIAVK